MAHQFRSKLQAGQQLLIGPMITLNSAVSAEILGSLDFDWLFIDAEHSTMSAGDIQTVIRAAGPHMPCLVRLEAPAELPVKKALDAGAAGIIAPMINSAVDAAKLVRWAKYAPMGTRGVGLSRAHGYGQRFAEYLAEANETTAVVVQAEHIEAVHNIEAIIQVPGVDAVLVGPYDLSASLGRMGDVRHPQVVEAIDHVTAVCLAAQIPLGIFGVSAAAVKPYIAKGYTLIVAGVDTLLLAQAAERLLEEIRD